MTAPTMTAVALSEFGPADVLRPADVAVPALGPDDVLVRVRAVSVGRTLDVATRAGHPPFASLLSLPHVLGADHVGDVVATGPEVTTVRAGARVAVFPVIACGRCPKCEQDRSECCPDLELLGIHRPGAYAQYCAVPERAVHAVPDAVTDREVCALALNGAVAHRQLDVAGSRPGDWVLVPGASGALGSALVALAAHRGLRVVAGTRSTAHVARLTAIGAEVVLDTAAPDLVDRVVAATGEHGVAAVIDNVVDPQVWTHLHQLLAPGGAAVCSGALTDASVTLDLRRMYLRNQSVQAVRTARPSDVAAVWKEAEDGFRAPLDTRGFTLADAAEAHRHLESDGGFGRVVLSVA